MSSASSASAEDKSFTPWWMVLIEGILAIIIGAYLIIAPVRTTFYLVYFLGWYWLITGVLTVALIFFDRSMWGWKLFSGIIGILAGGIIIYYPIASTFAILPITILIAAFLGIIYGVIFLFQAFRGSGWGVGILGVLSILFGLILLGNTLIAALTLPWVLGISGVVLGFLAIIMAFVVRSRQKQAAEELRRRQAATVMPPRPVPTSVPPVSAPATAAGSAAAGGAAAVAAVAAVASQPPAPVSPEPVAPVPPPVVEPPVEATSIPAEAAVIAAAVSGMQEEKPVEPAAPEGSVDEAEVEKSVEAAVDRDNPEEMAKFSYPLEYVEGIGPVYAGKLKEIGIVTPLDLLKGGAFPRGRADIAEKSGISGKLILEWVNHCDLYRIKGVGSEWADLLEEAGVDTVVELAMRNPKNLFDKMTEVNEEKKLVRKTPTQAQVEDWVEQAKKLPRVVNY
jgi:uncharacterized membrane protein HdeD (DUF308 family)/predicted flap endonuclease-1-like 5' DNA nuclease